jgi:hypothetical protein
MYFPINPTDIFSIESDSAKKEKMAATYERTIATGYYIESENTVTKSFPGTAPINDIITWACECGITGNLIITIDESGIKEQ